MTSYPPPGPPSSLVHRRPGLIAALITLVAAVAAVTVLLVVPGATRSAGPGLPAVDVAAAPGGPEVRDAKAGLRYTLPRGWTVLPSSTDFLYGISSAGSLHGTGHGAVVMVGVVDSSLFAASQPTPQAVARELAGEFGEFFVPTPGRREERVDRAQSVDGRDGWTAGYTVVPTSASDGRSNVAVTVVQDGNRRVFALVIVRPADPAELADAAASVSSIRFG